MKHCRNHKICNNGCSMLNHTNWLKIKNFLEFMSRFYRSYSDIIDRVSNWIAFFDIIFN
jgi:hypothetical protein